MEPYGVTENTLDIRGQQTVTFRLNGGRFTRRFLVCTLPKAAGLLGTDFLNQVGAKIDFVGGKLSVDHTEGAPRTCGVPPIGHVALTVFSQGKAGHRPLPERRRSVWTSSSRPTPPRGSHFARPGLARQNYRECHRTA
jgi:hypothetical protein